MPSRTMGALETKVDFCQTFTRPRQLRERCARVAGTEKTCGRQTPAGANDASLPLSRKKIIGKLTWIFREKHSTNRPCRTDATKLEAVKIVMPTVASQNLATRSRHGDAFALIVYQLLDLGSGLAGSQKMLPHGWIPLSSCTSKCGLFGCVLMLGKLARLRAPHGGTCSASDCRSLE